MRKKCSAARKPSIRSWKRPLSSNSSPPQCPGEVNSHHLVLCSGFTAWKDGAGCGTRTHDLGIMRPSLYL
jgi:hypothetical protein